MSGMVCVLAASRPGYAGLVSELGADTGAVFHLIEEPAEFTRDHLERLNPRYVFLPHWSHIVPAEIHRNFECVVFHMTDLPFGRGGTPLQNLIVRGFTETRLTAFRCVEELDSGPVYLKRPLALDGTAEQIYARGARLVGEMIREIIATGPEPRPQEGEVVVFKRRRPGQSDLSGLTDPRRIYDHIRMLDAEGYPHAFLETDRLRLEFTGAELRGGEVTARVRIVPRETAPGDMPENQGETP